MQKSTGVTSSLPGYPAQVGEVEGELKLNKTVTLISFFYPEEKASWTTRGLCGKAGSFCKVLCQSTVDWTD